MLFQTAFKKKTMKMSDYLKMNILLNNSIKIKYIIPTADVFIRLT